MGKNLFFFDSAYPFSWLAVLYKVTEAKQREVPKRFNSQVKLKVEELKLNISTQFSPIVTQFLSFNLYPSLFNPWVSWKLIKSKDNGFCFIYILQISIPFCPTSLKFVSCHSIHLLFVRSFGIAEKRRCNLIWNHYPKLLLVPLDHLLVPPSCTRLILARPNIKLKFKLSISANTSSILHPF